MFTCSTIEASLPRAKPHSSPRVTTALPSFTTIRFACFSSLRCANDFPCARLSGTVINGMLLQQRMDSFLNLWLWQGRSMDKERKEKNPSVKCFVQTFHPSQYTLPRNWEWEASFQFTRTVRNRSIWAALTIPKEYKAIAYIAHISRTCFKNKLLCFASLDTVKSFPVWSSTESLRVKKETQLLQHL